MRRVFAVLLFGLIAPVWAEAPPDGWRDLPRGRVEFDGRTLEYREFEGYALTEGDIQIGRIANGKEERRFVSLLPGSQFRWRNNTIPYTIDPELPRPERITDAVKEWNDRTPIRLVPRTDEANYVSFRRITSGCNSAVGMRSGEQRINLADNCSVGNTVHEIGHAVGLWHTQSRADRDGFLRVAWENIDKREWSQYAQHVSDGEELGHYDFSSMMHYGRTGFGRTFDPVVQTIPAGIPLGQRDGLSVADVDAVKRLYGETPDKVVLDTNPTGMKLVVDGEAVDCPCAFAWAPGETHRVAAPRSVAGPTANERFSFAVWSDGGAVDHPITVTPDRTVYIAHYAQEYRFRTGFTPADGGRVQLTPESSDGFYPAGTRLSVLAVPTDGFRFLSWVPGTGGATYQAAHGLGVSANPSNVWVRAANMFYAASFTDRPVTTITSSPPGRTVTVDNASGLTPRNFLWTPGSTHTLGAGTAVQLGPEETARYRFSSWSTGAEAVQTVAASDQGGVITAQFSVQHAVTSATDFVILAGTTRPVIDDVVLSPAGDSGFYDAGATVAVSTRRSETFALGNWYGDLTGNSGERTVTVNDQIFFTANFLSIPFFNASTVSNDASRQPGPVSPGALVSIFGLTIAPDQDAEGVVTDGRYETRLGAVRALFDNDPAQIVRTSRGQIQAIVPLSVAGKRSVTLVLENGVTRRTRAVGAIDANPGIYTTDRSGNGPADLTGLLTAGSEARILVTGVGELGDEGKPVLPVTVDIDGLTAEVLSASVSDRPGVTAVMFRIPAGLRTETPLPLTVRAGNYASGPGPTITITQ